MSLDRPADTPASPIGGGRVLVALLALGFIVALAGPTRLSGQIAQNPNRVRWSFFHNVGFGDQSGDFDGALEDLWTGEFGLRREGSGGYRFGLGASFGSFALLPPFEDELEFGLQRVFLTGGRRFLDGSQVRPYLDGRLGIARMHPRSEIFSKDPLPDDFEIGDSPTPATNGFHAGLVGGLEWSVGRSLALDLSLMADYLRVAETDLSPVAQPPGRSMFDWSVRLGVVWSAGDHDPASPPEPDAWGIRPSWGWAIGEALAINYVASAANEYIRNKNFNQISPRSWWSNVQDGFTYDDNEFGNNQFIHPFNGSQYFNAARSNGLGFWPSYAVALGAAFHWELAGETHPMSLNDLVATGVGGAVMGEAQYRLSSMILDNRDRGASRLFREATAFVVDPIRGFNRVVSGRAWAQRPNPVNPQDRSPPGGVSVLNAGWRRVGRGASLTTDVDDYGFLEYRHRHGNVFDQRRRGAFDFFTFEGQLNFGEKTPIGRLFIEGNLLTVPIGDVERPDHMLSIVQHFQYDNNNAYEYGGQSVGPSVFSRWGRLGRVGFETRVDLLATIMGGVNSDASELAEVADQERIREYDYGPGAGGNARFQLTWDGLPLLTVAYRLHFLYVVNGSVYHEDDLLGLDSRHWLHGVDARLELPLVQGIGAGARFISFTRESHYDISLPESLPPGVRVSQLIKQDSPELRLYLSWVPSFW